MGFFTVEGSDDFGKTWQEETTDPARDLSHATILLREDLDRTSTPSLTRLALKSWSENQGEAVVPDGGVELSKSRVQWRFKFVEN